MTRRVITVGGFWDPVVQTLADELAWEGERQCTTYVHAAATGSAAIQLVQQLLQEKR